MYRWSSYRWHACGDRDAVITEHAGYLALGRIAAERQAAYRALCRHPIDAGLVDEIRRTLHQSRVLGTERFKDAIEAALARRVRPGKPGRPRKLGATGDNLRSR